MDIGVPTGIHTLCVSLHANVLLTPEPRYADYAYLLLTLIPFVASLSTRFGPACLGGPTERLAAFLRADIPPARGAQADSLPFNWRWRKFPARDVEHLQREIEQDLGRQSTLSHDASKRHGSSDAENRRQLRRDVRACWEACF